jgi:hypothetical protein
MAVANPKETMFLPPTTMTKAAPAWWVMLSTQLQPFIKINQVIHADDAE